MKRREFFKDAIALAVTSTVTARAAGFFQRASAASVPTVYTAYLRPPGALPERRFLARCLRCHRCIDACPNQAILALDGSQGQEKAFTPAIKARRQACMLCNKLEGNTLKCTEACPSGALQLVFKDPEDIQRKVSMGVAEIDLALCYSYNNWTCGACYRACPFPGLAMTLGLWERPKVNPERCVGCGCCERACIRYPQAIRVRPRTA